MNRKFQKINRLPIGLILLKIQTFLVMLGERILKFIYKIVYYPCILCVGIYIWSQMDV